MVSATLSPFDAEEELAEEKPRTVPPRFIMAASKLRRVREMFEGYLKQSEPLFERLDTVQSQLGYTETLIRRFIASDSPRYFFQRMPCLSGLLTPEMLKHHLVKEMPERDQMIQTFDAVYAHDTQLSSRLAVTV